MEEIKCYDQWIELDFDFSSCEMTVQATPQGFALKLNGYDIDNAETLEALRDDSFMAVCRAVQEWIEDEVWSFIDIAVTEAWDSIESDAADEEDN
jgi:hypothetical protein